MGREHVMINPECPKCGVEASKHEGTPCFNAWLDELIYDMPKCDLLKRNNAYGWYHRGKTKPFGSGEFIRTQLRRVFDFSEWDHAGPLLEKMMPDIMKVVFMRWLKVPGYAIIFSSDVVGKVRAKTFPLVICRAYLIWKANQK